MLTVSSEVADSAHAQWKYG